jgi:hypothetical protein
MRRFRMTLLVCSVLACCSLAMAQQPEEVSPTAKGYSFDLADYSLSLYVYPGARPLPGTRWARQYPASAPISVLVTDASGMPVSGVPVSFKVEPDSQLKGMVKISPEQATTQEGGMAFATVQVTNSATSGVGDIIAQVGNRSDRVAVTVRPSRTAIP